MLKIKICINGNTGQTIHNYKQMRNHCTHTGRMTFAKNFLESIKGWATDLRKIMCKHMKDVRLEQLSVYGEEASGAMRSEVGHCTGSSLNAWTLKSYGIAEADILAYEGSNMFPERSIFDICKRLCEGAFKYLVTRTDTFKNHLRKE